MKKIININLSGRVIPIEDSAYEMLQAYIESLRRYFAKEEGRDEIINDIESRIAELMSEKVRLGSAAITDADINEIIASMGRPEDFDAVENETVSGAQASSQQNYQQDFTSASTKRRGRLYRDTSDKFVGGVCSGLANYLNVDPAIVRILFAIFILGGWGFLIYVLLWIFLPSKNLDGYSGKRLYRNPQERIIGGVASGLAAYFNKEVYIIRLVFLIPLILNIIFGAFSWPIFHEGSVFPNIVFGSLTSTFIFAYIILWIALPEAKSEYEQMEMRGERVDLNTIRQNVKERAREFGEEVRSSARNISSKTKEFAGTRGKAFVAEAGETARRTGRGIGRGIGHVIAVLFKAFFLFIAGTIAFALFVCLLGLIFGGIGIWPLKNFILDGFWENAFAWGTLILFLGIPLIGFITWLLRRIMKVRSQSNYLGWTFGGLWTLGWISVACLAASLVNDFRMSNDRTGGTAMTISQPVNGKMIVQVSEPEVEYSGSLPWIDIDGSGMDITRDSFRLANVRIRVEQSKDSAYHVDIKKYSRGKSIADAEMKAQSMLFNMFYKDSILDVGSGISIGKGTKFRGQQAVVIIKIPAGKKIRFDESVDKLHAINIRIKRDRNWGRRSRDFDIDMDEYFDYKTNVDYTMGSDGELIDPLGNHVTNDYKYNDSSDNRSGPSDIQKQLEDEKRKREESDRKIRDLEKKQKENNSKPIGFRKNEERDNGLAISPSPVFSLINTFN